MRPFFTLISILILLATGCAKTPAEKTTEAIDKALTYLSNEECDDAIKVLEDIGVQSDDAVYLEVLASAYACSAGYREVAFIVNDVGGMVTSTPEDIMKSIASFDLSRETAADSDNYVAMRSGIELLLGSTSPVTHAARVTKFGPRKAGDMGVEALMFNVVNLGKFLHVFGNTDDNGVKGAGTNTNSCFLSYTDARAQAVVTSGVTGACTVSNDGHPDLSLAAADLPDTKRRLCEGLMTVTNILDILDNLDLSGSSELSNLEDISTQVETFRTVAVAAGLGTLIDMTSQSECETYLGTASNLDDMQYLYSLVFETGLQ